MNLLPFLMAAKSPCEKYECSQFANCKESLLSCEAFTYYVEEGRSIHPAMQRGENGKFHMTAGPNPTRREFELIRFDD